MGDRCYFSMTILKQDREAVDRIMFGESSPQPWPEEEDNGDGTITLFEYEANYAYNDQRQELAEAGIVFCGYHGRGGEYSEGVFACLNGEQVQVAAIEAMPVVFMNRDGRIEKWSLKAARDYCRMLRQVEEHFKTKGGHEEEDVQEAGDDREEAEVRHEKGSERNIKGHAADEKDRCIYIIGNPEHWLGFMVASPDDPLGYDDPVAALSDLGQMRQDSGNHLKLYRLMPVEGPVASRDDLERYNGDCEVEGFDYSLVEEYLE